MKRMSFALTKPQLLDGSKTVTRRLGWSNLASGDRLRAVSKCMGLKPGEQADVYGVVEVIDARRERLDAITQEDCAREGFPHFAPKDFVAFFIEANPRVRVPGTKRTEQTTPATPITRIEFRFTGDQT